MVATIFDSYFRVWKMSHALIFRYRIGSTVYNMGWLSYYSAEPAEECEEGAVEHRAGEGAVKMFTTSAFLDKYHPSPRRHAVDNPPGV